MLLLLFWPTSVKLINSKFLLVLSLVVYIIYKFINLFTDRFTISLGYKLLSAEQALIIYQRLRAIHSLFLCMTHGFYFIGGATPKFLCGPYLQPTTDVYIKQSMQGRIAALRALGITSHFSRPSLFPSTYSPVPLTFLFLPLSFPPFPSFSFRSRLLKCS